MSNPDIHYGFTQPGEDATDLRAAYVSKSTLVFQQQHELDETLDLTGMSSKTLVSKVPMPRASTRPRPQG